MVITLRGVRNAKKRDGLISELTPLYSPARTVSLSYTYRYAGGLAWGGGGTHPRLIQLANL